MHIDSEVHFWKYDKTLSNPFIRNNKLLQQNYLPEQITQSLHRNGILGCVAVVSESSELETRFLSELALTHPEIRGVVGWIDLQDIKAGEKIAEFEHYSPVRGYQVNLSGHPLPSPEIMGKLQANGYSLDILLDSDDTADLNKWLAKYPEQVFILQNGGSPDTRQPPTKEWEQTIRKLANNQQLHCKVSGLLERSNWKSWKPGDFYPFLEILFDSFGVDRLLYASNWPMLLLGGMYVQWKSLLEKFCEKFSEEDKDKFFGENAVRLYRL